jgi:hypothetical protein
MIIKRWSSSGKGRSSCVALDGMVWTVANAMDMTANFESQVAQSFAMLDMHLTEALSARTHILSLQVILADIRTCLTHYGKTGLAQTLPIGRSAPATKLCSHLGCWLNWWLRLHPRLPECYIFSSCSRNILLVCRPKRLIK